MHWHALNGPQAAYADKYGCARVYKEPYGFFAGLSEYTEKAYRDLASIVRPGRIITIINPEYPIEYPEWKQVGKISGYGMVLEAPVEVPDFTYVKLSRSDTDEMLELAQMTGLSSEFRANYIELGDYYGIKKEGCLVAMAGERIKMDGYTEVSGVCTHPDCRRQGYARGLTAHVSHKIQEREETTFLLVRKENIGAIKLYEKMGFKKAGYKYLDILLRTDIQT